MIEGGFILRKWTNDDELRERINSSERKIYNESEVHKTDTTNKVLGINWDVNNDKLIFSVEDVVKQALSYKGIISRRYVLKVIASNFDPIGPLTPVTVGFKILLQEICQMKYGRDDEICCKLQMK